MFPFYMFVHISSLVAGVVADGTAPALLSSNIKSLYHLGLYYPVKLCRVCISHGVRYKRCSLSAMPLHVGV